MDVLPDEDELPTALEHTYSEDGLLRVNPKSRKHPVLELVEKAEENWQRKLDRASKTLEEAVAEYQRRYGRRPPLGFDDWFVSSLKYLS